MRQGIKHQVRNRGFFQVQSFPVGAQGDGRSTFRLLYNEISPDKRCRHFFDPVVIEKGMPFVLPYGERRRVMHMDDAPSLSVQPAVKTGHFAAGERICLNWQFLVLNSSMLPVIPAGAVPEVKVEAGRFGQDHFRLIPSCQKTDSCPVGIFIGQRQCYLGDGVLGAGRIIEFCGTIEPYVSIDLYIFISRMFPFFPHVDRHIGMPLNIECAQGNIRGSCPHGSQMGIHFNPCVPRKVKLPPLPSVLMQLRSHKDPCHGAKLEVHIPPDRPVIPAVFYANSPCIFICRIHRKNINPPGTLRIPAPYGHIPADVQPAGRLDPHCSVKAVIGRLRSVILTIDTDIDIAPHCDIPGSQPYNRGRIVSFKNKVCPGIVLFYVYIPANGDLTQQTTIIVGYMPAIVGSPDSQLSCCPSVRHFHPAVFLSSQIQVSGNCQFTPVFIYAEIYVSPVHLPFIGIVQAHFFGIYGDRFPS